METKKSPAKTIAEIQVNILNELPTPRERFLDDYHYCPLCGDELIYAHVTHFADCVVNEQAECPSCHVRVKNNNHKLQ